MQINIDKKTGTLLGVIVVLVLALVFFFAGNTNMSMNHGGHGSMSSDEDASGPYSDDELMFAQMMIPHHSQAVELATLAESNTTTPAILDLAARIKGAQQPEIDAMTAWLAAAGAMEGGHGAHGMSMPGLVSDADMAALEQATGAEFDALFLTHMIQHHDGAITMANDVLATTANDDVAALGTAIVAGQTAEIAEMYALLGP
jgi:uncharacterized protein (DUF305 family)